MSAFLVQWKKGSHQKKVPDFPRSVPMFQTQTIAPDCDAIGVLHTKKEVKSKALLCPASNLQYKFCSFAQKIKVDNEAALG